MEESDDQKHFPVPHLLMRHPVLPNHFCDANHHDAHFAFSPPPPPAPPQRSSCVTYMTRPCSNAHERYMPTHPTSAHRMRNMSQSDASHHNSRPTSHFTAEFQSRAQNLNAIARSLHHGRTPQTKHEVRTQIDERPASANTSTSSPDPYESSIDISPIPPTVFDTAMRTDDADSASTDKGGQKVEQPEDVDKQATLAGIIMKKRRNYIYNPKPIVQRVKVMSVMSTKEDNDVEYLEMRCRNNEAARRSRHLRRQKELEVMSQRKELKFSKIELENRLRDLKSKCEYMEKLVLRRFDNEH